MGAPLIAIARDDHGRGALMVRAEQTARIRAELGAIIGEREFPLHRSMLIGETRLSLHPVPASAQQATIALLTYAAGRLRPPLLFADPIEAIAAMSWEAAAGRRIEGTSIVHTDSLADLFAAMGRPPIAPQLPAVPIVIDQSAIDPQAWCPRCMDHRLPRVREAGPRSLINDQSICAPCAQLEAVRLAWLAALAHGRP